MRNSPNKNKPLALITGAAQGIGFSIAELFLSNGYLVIAADINKDKGLTAQAVLGEYCEFLNLDITKEEQWKSAISDIVKRYGKLDALVNCAGISLPGSIEDCSYELFKKTQSINVDSVFLGCKYAIEAMKDKGGGCIVNIGSTLGLRPLSIHTPYGASKAAVNHITKTAALHCAEQRYKIRINAVHPGAVKTPMYENYLEMSGDPEAAAQAFAETHPMGRIAQPEDIANAVYFLCSDKSSFITGLSMPVDGGYTA